MQISTNTEIYLDIVRVLSKNKKVDILDISEVGS